MNSPTKQTMKSHKDWISLFLWISLFSAFLWGCSGNKQAYLGKYYVNKNRPELFDFIFYKRFIAGTKLELRDDSTFYMETCAIKSYGKWKTDGRKIYLFSDTTFYKIDSFNYIPKYANRLKQRKNHIDTFHIKKKKLIRILKNPHTIDRLIKVK